MNYTVTEVAKKLKVSKGLIYDLVKRGKLNKVPCLGRVVRISGNELKKYKSNSEKYFLYDSEKVEVIETTLGKVRKIRDKDFYVLTDVVKAVGIGDSHTIAKAIDRKFLWKLSTQEAKDYGFFSNQFGILLIYKDGITQYGSKTRYKNTLAAFIKELNINNNVQIKATETIQHSGIQIFKNPEFGQVRWVKIENKPYAVGSDIAKALGYGNPRDAVLRHCRSVVKFDTATKQGNSISISTIPEGDIYRLVIKAADQSKNPEIKKKAEHFEKWLFNDMLPTVNHTGGYIQKGREQEFTNNYFSNLSDETKKLIVRDLKNKNTKLENEKTKLDKQIKSNNEALIQLEA